MKTTVSENPLDGVNSISETAKEQISKFVNLKTYIARKHMKNKTENKLGKIKREKKEKRNHNGIQGAFFKEPNKTSRNEKYIQSSKLKF